MIATLSAWLVCGGVLSACPICFQIEDAGTAMGVRAAVVVLGGVTAGVLVGVAMFARRIARYEARELPDLEVRSTHERRT